MIRNYFKTAWRNIIKRKFYSLINIAGLSLAIACTLFLYLFISFHASFDRYHKNSSSTYRIVNDIFFEKAVHIRGASMGMYTALGAGFPQVNDVSVILSKYSFTVTVNNGKNTANRFAENKNVALVAPGWFKMFTYKFLYGSAEQLKVPNTAVITQSLARKYFGAGNALDKVLEFPGGVPVKVVGVISDAPFNTDLRSGIFVSLSSLKTLFPVTEDNFLTDWAWINTNTSVYLTLNDKSFKQQVETGLNNLAKSHLGGNAKYYHFMLQPLSEVHFDSNFGGSIQRSLLFTLGLIGLCILLMAGVNYINLSVAQQAKRMVEIGTRKVLGASPWKLFSQFITETFIMVSLAVLIAMALIVLLFPVANHSLFASEPIHLLSYTNVVGFLVLILLALVFLSGVYPAVVLSRIPVFKAFKGASSSWKAGLFRKVLVVMQNAVAYTLITCTIIMVLQVQFLKHAEIGFNSNAVMMISLPDSSTVKRDLLRQRLQEMPLIAAYSFCYSAPSSENDWGGSVKFADRPEWESWQGRSEVGDSSYVNTFGLQLVAGRNMRGSSTTAEFLVNEKMISKLGLKDPADAIGKRLTVGEFNDQEGIIAGVVKDFNTQSLLVPIEPVIIANVPGKFSAIGLKLKGADFQAALAGLRKSWEEIYPQEVFDYRFIDDQIAALYRRQDLQQKITRLAALVAIVISCLGLLGLVSLVTLQRTKEIGIRKILGASAKGVVALITKDFLKLVFVAIIIATPLGWWLMDEWLQDFAYHITISWWVFFWAALSAISIALFTISFQSVKAALANPVKSLRTE